MKDSTKHIIALAGVVVAILACLATFVVLEVGRFIGLERSDAMPAPTLTNTPVPPTPTPLPASPPANCALGDTWTRPIDGMVMVCVPAGEFLMGSTDADPRAWDDEKPQHTVYLDAFWIDKTEVTHAQYRKCVEAGGCKEPFCWDYDTLNAPNQPVVCMRWHDAQAYVTWLAQRTGQPYRLPTEAEWEKAARGTDGRLYPWGNAAPDCTRANSGDCEDRPVSVGSYPAGASPYGALDMAGSVSEWCQSLFEPYPYQVDDGREDLPKSGHRVLRGGYWGSDPEYVRCAVRYSDWSGHPGPYSTFYGFRVARGPLE